jgi:hypothetical protein
MPRPAALVSLIAASRSLGRIVSDVVKPDNICQVHARHAKSQTAGALPIAQAEPPLSSLDVSDASDRAVGRRHRAYDNE